MSDGNDVIAIVIFDVGFRRNDGERAGSVDSNLVLELSKIPVADFEAGMF